MQRSSEAVQIGTPGWQVQRRALSFQGCIVGCSAWRGCWMICAPRGVAAGFLWEGCVWPCMHWSGEGQLPPVRQCAMQQARLLDESD
jgi:hypothetical protein